MARSATMKRMRERAIKEQDGKCFYCHREFDEAVTQLRPVGEHFVPNYTRAYGERQVVVAACTWCDIKKGLLTGEEFIAIIAAETANTKFVSAQPEIARKARAMNRERREKLPKGNRARTIKAPTRRAGVDASGKDHFEDIR